MKDKTITYSVSGMHCPACEMVVERKLSQLDYLSDVKAELKTQMVTLRMSSTADENAVIQDINSKLNGTGYQIKKEATSHTINYKELLYGFLISLVVIFAFIILQRLGITRILSDTGPTWSFIFTIGIVASLSSCMALVGGLVLSISAKYSQGRDKVLPLTFFHIARLIAFFVLGGFMGLLGSVFTLSQSFYFAVSIILFIVMMILGINLLNVIPFFRKLQISLPKSWTQNSVMNSYLQSRLAPILLGIITFFLPCGFTQSMQINAIASGSFINGALIMLIFALGTLPVLALISFTSVRLGRSANSGIFFKAAGFVVLFFAVFNFYSSLVAAGIIMPIV
jgi:sulfite exporter TauE/SafE/copper chaperone CopZ